MRIDYCANGRDKYKLDDVRIMKAVREILEAIGEDPEREGLKNTPRRIARMFEEIFCGLGKDPRKELTPIFNEEHEEMVIIKDIPFYSMCEHHLLPFHGKAHVAYLPKGGRVVGLSKLARVVEILARRPQLQERLTSEVADMIFEALKPHGVVIVVEAYIYVCQCVNKQAGSIAVTLQCGAF